MEREPQEQPESTPTQVESSTPTQNLPPTPPVDSPSISTDGRALYQAVLLDKNKEIERLQRELENSKKQPEKVLTQQEESAFFEKPLTNTKELIKSELQQQLAPMYDFINNFQQTSRYDTIKRGIKAQNPAIAGLLTPDIEPYVDQAMSGIAPTEQNLIGVILQVKGAQAAGLLTTAPQTTQTTVNNPITTTVTQPPTQQAPNLTVPAHLRPSAPPAPKLDTSDNQPKRPLSENERRLMREWGMTEEEYRTGQVRNDDNVGPMVLEPDTKPKQK